MIGLNFLSPEDRRELLACVKRHREDHGIARRAVKEHGNASLQAGSTTSLSSIKGFGEKTYTEDEEKALSEIIDNFNQRHGTEFTKEDFLRFEQVNREILGDEDLREMLKNNPPDVVFGAFSHAFFEGAIKLFQKDKQLQNIVMSDAKAREQATRHFFSRALRKVQAE